uniref:Uncharacterized protein n=1 Tax=Chlamydomonas leiostraca TaxID=1034604 RepID=A0A7S0S2W1_9CHLO|mmetsp:Transcript_5013/g.12328  ORF Transcript_5013/g.12328 Transcript_5013/m.12328 type:complete len:100 (+) Transcript_5013:65-364(+)|eukprot:CAMPEP_0202863576 /NCGR_PEP_ID=MMETSP1391-20130828/4156_1 /ASSEMBLY_ACC=CAM_ASM_000867 /TAXON_ID=1034604 /ORGANISM="Chlamydomonas leiostraca, Strain SAG 11-49" /LENGTH=99 /DNA_ID=CAMNT_0049543225 /DNA_START=108 /DNA_END=407 /DNA_ORIENTATION=+
MAFSLSHFAGAAHVRPTVSTRAVQKGTPGTASGAGSAGPAPTPSGGMPLWALPALAVAVAAPVYGFQKNQREIAVARAAWEKKKAEAAKAGTTTASKKA